MGNDLIPHQQPFSYRRPPLPSTTLSLINCPSPIDDPLSLQRPSSLINNPSPFNDLIHHQQPLFYRQTPLPSTISSFINHPLCYRRPRLLSTTASAFEMPDIVAERLKALPTSCEYSGLAYFPPSSFGEVLDCILLLGFSSDKALENWVSQLFGRHIDKPVDKLPGIVEAICRGKVGEGDDWASKLGEPNKAQLNAIQTPTKFFDPIINDWYEGVPQVQQFVLLCDQSFDKGCGRGSKRLCGNGLGTK